LGHLPAYTNEADGQSYREAAVDPYLTHKIL